MLLIFNTLSADPCFTLAVMCLTAVNRGTRQRLTSLDSNKGWGSVAQRYFALDMSWPSSVVPDLIVHDYLVLSFKQWPILEQNASLGPYVYRTLELTHSVAPVSDRLLNLLRPHSSLKELSSFKFSTFYEHSTVHFPFTQEVLVKGRGGYQILYIGLH